MPATRRVVVYKPLQSCRAEMPYGCAMTVRRQEAVLDWMWVEPRSHVDEPGR